MKNHCASNTPNCREGMESLGHRYGREQVPDLVCDQGVGHKTSRSYFPSQQGSENIDTCLTELFLFFYRSYID